MATVNMLEAKASLSRLVKEIESGREREIIIARNGKPAAKLVAIDAGGGGRRLGAARGKFNVPESIDENSEAITKLFGAERVR